jgi:hypothetical protein
MGIVIKLIEHEVSFEEYVAPIESITAAEVVFRYVSASYTMTGTIDRVTGKASIEKLFQDDVGSVLMLLTCRPASPDQALSACGMPVGAAERLTCTTAAPHRTISMRTSGPGQIDLAHREREPGMIPPATSIISTSRPNCSSGASRGE